MKYSYIYIITNKPCGTLYIGVTSNLIQRIFQHKEKIADGFSKKYNLTKLVWFEQSESMSSAILREKQLKTWQRQWKIQLIETSNPQWLDLYDGILK